jgi:hypothetical protein
MKRRSFFARLAGAVGLVALAPPKAEPIDIGHAVTGKWVEFIDRDVTNAKWIDLADSKQITICGFRDGAECHAEGHVYWVTKVLP